jgi:signal transduction histidine kinase
MGYHPTATALRGVIDRLLFGERREPLDAASRVGARLGDDPVLALRALREALALPYAALLDGAGGTVAVTGTPITEVLTHPLAPGRPELGRLEVGLRPGEVALPARDRDVLTVLGPALAQLMHARTLGAQLQASRAEVVAVVEEERRRLRRDLHDGLGPRLTGVAYTADAARNLLHDDPERTLELLAGLRAEAGHAIVEVRRLVDGLRPAALDQVGLVQALRQHAGTLRGHDGEPLTVVVEAQEPLPALGAAVEVTAYRIVVEALTNAARHSGARHCRVCLRPSSTRLLVEVTDDGGPGRPWVPGVGLTSMRERAELLGGSFSASAEPGGGRVCVQLPAAALPA